MPLVRDDAFADRAFVRLGPPADPTFYGLAAAVRDVAEQVDAVR